MEIQVKDEEARRLIRENPIAALCSRKALNDMDATPESMWRDIALALGASQMQIASLVAKAMMKPAEIRLESRELRPLSEILG